MQLNIIVADDHALIRKGLVALLRTCDEIGKITEASTEEELLNAARSREYQVLLFDLNISFTRGSEVLRDIKLMNTGVKCLVLSLSENEDIIAAAFEKGAAGYIAKNAGPEEMMIAIRTVAEKGCYFNETATGIMYRRLSAKRKKPAPSPKNGIRFSEKEITIIRFLSQELSSAEIGRKVYLSHRTIETIRQQMLRKAGVKTATGLVLYAVRHGMIDF